MGVHLTSDFIAQSMARDSINTIVKKNRLIQPMVITLEEGGGGEVKRVMISFCKFKLCECKRQIYASI